MDISTAMLKNSMIIAAHPDDEILWFGSICDRVDEITILYRDLWADPEIGKRRSDAIAEFPRDGVSFLALQEPGSFDCADWQNPRIDQYGLAFGSEGHRRTASRLVRKSMAHMMPGSFLYSSKSVSQAYRDSFDELYETLKPKLRPAMNVFTHNPWGEYGHEDHVQTFRVVDKLRREIGFTLWMSNYCTERSLPLATKYFTRNQVNSVRIPVNKAFAQQVATHYRTYKCWTWADDWEWFDDEYFIEAPRCIGDGNGSHLMPLNFFNFGSVKRSIRTPVMIGAVISTTIAGMSLMAAME